MTKYEVTALLPNGQQLVWKTDRVEWIGRNESLKFEVESTAGRLQVIISKIPFLLTERLSTIVRADIVPPTNT
jgi:hypothetical protein